MRSATDCKLAGVCGGLAEYMNADPTFVRLIWALVTLLSGFVFGAVAYLVAWIIMPVAPVYVPAPAAAQQQAAQAPNA
ncbi:MAG: PspC domain-containing protein [Candidatus Acidiferrales bacterium]